MNWYEIITNGGGRPDYPEDNTIIIKAYTMEEAIDSFKKLKGAGVLRIIGTPTKCRQIYHIWGKEEMDDKLIKK